MYTISPSRPSPSVYAIDDDFVPSCELTDGYLAQIASLEQEVTKLKDENSKLHNTIDELNRRIMPQFTGI